MTTTQIVIQSIVHIISIYAIYEAYHTYQSSKRFDDHVDTVAWVGIEARNIVQSMLVVLFMLNFATILNQVGNYQVYVFILTDIFWIIATVKVFTFLRNLLKAIINKDQK